MYVLQIALTGFVLGTQVLLIAVALHLIHAVAKLHHLGLGAIATAVAYAIYFGVEIGWPIAIVALFGATIATILGWATFALLESFTERREALLGMLASFAFGIALEACIAIQFGTDGKNLVATILPTVSIGELYVTTPGLATIILGLVLAVGAFLVVQFTPAGRLVRSIAENPFAVRSLGVNQKRTRLAVYIAASVLAGTIGVLIGLNTALTPLMGFNVMVTAFMALLVGGTTSDLRGTIIASYLLVLIPEFVIGLSPGGYDLSVQWKAVLVFLLASALLILRPQGLFTSARRTA